MPSLMQSYLASEPFGRAVGQTPMAVWKAQSAAGKASNTSTLSGVQYYCRLSNQDGIDHRVLRRRSVPTGEGIRGRAALLPVLSCRR